MFLCSLAPYNNSSKLVRRTRNLATSLKENKFILFPIKQRKFICLHLPENSSKDRVLYFTQIAQFIIYRFFIDLTLNCWRNSLSKILVKYPFNSFGSANYWIQERFRKSRVRTKKSSNQCCPRSRYSQPKLH